MCRSAFCDSQRTSVSKNKPGLHARVRIRARVDEKGVVLAYLNVLISPARISGCTKGCGRPFGAAGGGSHLAWSIGEFSLWLRERAATTVIYLMRGLGREERGEENFAEGMEELRSGHALSWRGREKSERKCVEKQWPAASAPSSSWWKRDPVGFLRWYCRRLSNQARTPLSNWEKSPVKFPSFASLFVVIVNIEYR